MLHQPCSYQNYMQFSLGSSKWEIQIENPSGALTRRKLNFLIKLGAAPPWVIKNILKLLRQKVLSAGGYQHLLLFVAKFAQQPQNWSPWCRGRGGGGPFAALFAPGNFADYSWPLWQSPWPAAADCRLHSVIVCVLLLLPLNLPGQLCLIRVQLLAASSQIAHTRR